MANIGVPLYILSHLMKKGRIRAKLVPKQLHLEISEDLSSYTVAICRIQKNDPITFRVLGSGVCVVRNGRHGILTAHHCLHACSPQVSLGNRGSDRIMFMVRMGRTIFAEPHELIEHPLAHPSGGVYGEFGPDLSFIEIPPGPRLSSFKSIASFWNLNRRSSAVTRKYCLNRIYLSVVGFPEERFDIKISRAKVEFNLGHISFAGALEKSEDIELKGKWDFVRLVCDDNYSSGAPTSFAGVSGGPIWAIRLRRKKDKSLTVLDFCLVGVAFFERRLGKRNRIIRGHFIRSIYTHAWKSMSFES